MTKTATSKGRPIVVIGAGIVGISTAIWLQRDGHEVVLIDREGPAAGTSYGNGGVLASCGVIPVNAPGLLKKAPAMVLNPDSPLFLRWSYLPKMLPWLKNYLARANADDTRKAARALTGLLYDSLQQHQQLALGTPAERWLVPSDYVFVYDSRADFEADGFGWQLRREMGFNWDELSPAEFAEYEPVFSGSGKMAIRLKNHGHITDPGKYVEDLVAHFVKQGGTLEIADVSDLHISDGAVTHLETNTGKIACSSVVLAAGVWSKPLADKLGIKVPLESERGYHIELINPSVVPSTPLMLVSGKFVVTPMDGRIRCAGIVEFGGLDAAPSSAPFALLEKQIRQAIPGLSWERTEKWMGHRPAPTDSIPLIGPFPGVANAYAGFGHHHIGLTGGPKTGKLIADMIASRQPNTDLAPYQVERFT